MSPTPNWLGLLSDEERVPHDDASAIRRAGELVERQDSDLDLLFVAANLLSLVLFRRGRLDAARSLCRAEIDYARTRPPGPGRARALALALQPQVNLLRIEGYAGSLDRCLAGLTALEQVARGNGVHTEELDWTPEEVADDPALTRRVRLLARNIRVADTCKILLRRGRTEELLHQARRFDALWPRLVETGLQHAAEAPWAACPTDRQLLADRQPPTAQELSDGTVQQRRLALVRGLHCAAHAVAADEEGALPLARLLDARLPAVAADGPWASALTVPRWRGVLGATLLRAGDDERGAELMREALAVADAQGDTALARGLRQRLGAVPHEPAVTEPSAAPDQGTLDTLLARMLARLARPVQPVQPARPATAGV